MRAFCIAAGILGLLLGAPGTARSQAAPPELEVYYPLPQSVVEDPYLTVEGRVTTRDVDEFEIRINDGRPHRVRVRDGFFAEEVDLDEGMNTLDIGGVLRNVFVATPRAAAPPAGFNRVYGHHALDDGCLECHVVKDDGKLGLAGEREEICLWCHGDLVHGRAGKSWGSVHAPVKEGKCLSCHRPHLATAPGLLAEKVPPCAECHAAVSERLKTDRFVHGPMNLGDCRLCHTIHASAEPGLLVRPATALCTDCHSDALPPPGTPAALQPHTMIPQGQCARCHEAHSSPNPRMLRQPAGRLCHECHQSKTRSFHEEKGFSIYICAKCHDLHRPTQPHLIVDASRSLCLQCHDYRGDATFTHSFVREGRCFLCHTFHEASLPGDVATTCLQCHRDTPNLPAVHRGVPFERSRCTNCHLPHQSTRPKLLRAEEHTPFKKRECDPCHRERADKIGSVYRPLCIGCHAGLDLSALQPPPAEVHPPFRDQDCGVCHRGHNAEVPNLLVAPGNRLCLECHRKLKKSTLLAPKSSHTAFLEGRCGACHNPHVSENRELLKRPPTELCGGCHAAVLLGPGGVPWERLHKPVVEGKCRLCHRPHTSINASLLRVATPQECRPCHQELFASLESTDARSLHAPVKEGKCSACHRVHGSPAAGLLPAGGIGPLCAGCHGNLKGTHHRLTPAELQTGEGREAAAARGCLICHQPHASGSSRLLLSAGSPICQGCHKT